jgi:hypothetical protein
VIHSCHPNHPSRVSDEILTTSFLPEDEEEEEEEDEGDREAAAEVEEVVLMVCGMLYLYFN